jgi:hypothetical protein
MSSVEASSYLCLFLGDGKKQDLTPYPLTPYPLSIFVNDLVDDFLVAYRVCPNV